MGLPGPLGPPHLHPALLGSSGPHRPRILGMDPYWGTMLDIKSKQDLMCIIFLINLNKENNLAKAKFRVTSFLRSVLGTVDNSSSKIYLRII